MGLFYYSSVSGTSFRKSLMPNASVRLSHMIEILISNFFYCSHSLDITIRFKNDRQSDKMIKQIK